MTRRPPRPARPGGPRHPARPRHLTAVAASPRLTEADLDDLLHPGFERYLPPSLRPPSIDMVLGTRARMELPVLLVCTACREAVASADDIPPLITSRQERHRCTGQLQPNPYHDAEFDEPAPATPGAPAAPARPPGPCPAHTAWPASPWRCLVTGCPSRQERSRADA
jgi:hypothetical protein